MNIEIHAVTVCVNYAHLFKHCIPNKRFFKRWVIVTTEEDTDTIQLCKDNNLEYIFSKVLYDRTFFKSGAINEGFNYLGKDKTWYLHIDADVLLKDNFASTFPTHPIEKRPYIMGYTKNKGKEETYTAFLDSYFHANALYTMGRINVDIDEDFTNFDPAKYFELKGSIKQKFNGYGFFQLFNLPRLQRLYKSLYEIYPTLSDNAGADDGIFQKMFGKKVSLDTYCLHLSPEGKYWDGI
tara:strand:+ start:3428 stop:4141 length:714 start_codon:yes stop_codon:yes gene_type:complete